MTDGASDRERISALGAEIAGHDERAVQPRKQTPRPPRWLVRLRLTAVLVFAGEAIYGGISRDARLLISGTVLFVVWLGLLAK